MCSLIQLSQCHLYSFVHPSLAADLLDSIKMGSKDEHWLNASDLTELNYESETELPEQDLPQQESPKEMRTSAHELLRRRRRAQNAVFDKSLTDALSQGSLKAKIQAREPIEVADDELSIQALMAKQTSHIIKNPREYQRELFEIAKERNSIAVLDTGSGKTLIAAQIGRAHV